MCAFGEWHVTAIHMWYVRGLRGSVYVTVAMYLQYTHVCFGFERERKGKGLGFEEFGCLQN